MRVVVGRLVLLLGVVVVGAMAWYGATALFGDDADDESSPDAECVAVPNRTEARAAQRRLVRQYGREPWFSGSRLTTTRDVGSVVGDGWLVLVDVKPRGDVAELPSCLGDVPVRQE